MKPRHLLSLLMLSALFCIFTTVSSSAQDANDTNIIGLPPLSTVTGGPENINLGNLNIHWEFPIITKQGRGMSFKLALGFDSFGDGSRFYTISSIPNGSVSSAKVSSVQCGGSGFDKIYIDTYGNWAYKDSFNITHRFPTASITLNNCTHVTTSSGPVSAPDGSGYLLNPVIGAGDIWAPSGIEVSQNIMTDTNGNSLTSVLPEWQGGNTVTWKDTAGIAVVTATPGFIRSTVPPPQPPFGPDKYTYIDSNGAQQAVTVNWGAYTVQNSFPTISNGVCTSTLNPPTSNVPMANSIVYPDGRTYSFTYEPTPGVPGNVTGRLQSVNLPAGATITYTYSGPNEGVSCDPNNPLDTSTLGLTRQGPDGTTSYTRTQLSGTEWKTVVTYPPDSVTGVQSQTDLYFQNPWPSAGAPYPTNNLQETKRLVFQGSDQGTPIQTVQTCYNGSAPDCTATQVTLPITQITKLAQLSSGRQSQVVTFMNTAGMVTEKDEYDYGSGAPGSLLRKAATQYASLRNNILDRPSSVTVEDGSGNQIAQTTNSYDSRGNATSTSRWLNTTNSSLTTTRTYDPNNGNLLTTTDPKNNTTTYDYTDNYSDGVNRNSLEYVTKITLPVTGSVSHVTTSKYDPNTGLRASDIDENGNETDYGYDLMLRPSSVKLPPDGNGNRPQTTLTYPDPNTVEQQKTITTTTSDTTTAKLDGLGRTAHILHSTPGGTVTTDATYDSLGRLFKLTNPYYSTSDSTYGVTTHQYDALSREIQTTEQDGSTATIQYNQTASTSANTDCTTTTDESSKQSKACHDGIGRLLSVWEDPAGLGYETDYQYDLLGNLLRVDQKGSAPSDSSQWRTRTFTYDSLSRLTQATNPESGTIKYSYDADGNMTQKVAPAPNQSGSATVTTSYSYDALNRLTQKSYSDGATPTVNFLYDVASGWGNPSVPQTNLVGRLSEIYGGGTTTTGNQVFSYDAPGRVIVNNQCIPSDCGSGNYPVSASYDLSNNLISLSYPSGRVVTFNYNAAEELDQVQFASFNGSAPSGGAFNYWSASDTNFYANGVPKSWALGNAVTESTVLNKRLQLQEQTVGNSAIYNFADHVYNYGTNDNGNILSITDTLNSSRTQNFDYDTLNRLSSATEARWGLGFVYDAWANRLQQNVTSGTANQIQITVDGNNHIQGAPSGCTASTRYCYDSAGNLLHDNLDHQYIFDAENRITQVDSSAAAYTYTAEGDRVRKDLSGLPSTEYIYFNGNVIAERNVSTGDWTDYVWANGKRIVKAASFDNGLRIYGTRCGSCGTQYSLFYLNIGTLGGYTIRSGDRLDLTQYQLSGSKGGVVFAFTDGTNTNWNLKDRDGYYANDDQKQTTTHFRQMDLSSFAGKTISQIALDQESDTAAGSFAIIYEELVLTSTDGTVQPLYTGESSSPVTSIVPTPGVTGTGTRIDVNEGKGTYPTTTTTYYHSSQINSSTMITAGGGWPVWQATYLPFGEEYGVEIGVEHYKFTGKERDETALDYFGERFDVSLLGRFLTSDPLMASGHTSDPQSWNRYAYVRNNPIRFTDPLGLLLQDCNWTGGCMGAGGLGGTVTIDGLSESTSTTLGGNQVVECPNNVCNGFTNSGSYFEFVAGAGGATGYVKFSDLANGINEWGGLFYSDQQFQKQVIAPAIDRARWALANAIAKVNGQDPAFVYSELHPGGPGGKDKVVGGNVDFRPGPDIDLSFLNPKFSLTDPDSLNHQGAFPAIHMHSDGLIHLDTANPLAWFPLGAIAHLAVDLGLGKINGNVPLPH